MDAYKQVNGDARRIPTPQDLKQLNKSYPTFTRYHQLNKGADRDLSELMYSGRDRRFYTAIVYDKCSWIGETVELNLVETSQQVSVTRKMEAGTIPLPVIIGVKATLKTLHPELTIIARWHCISISFDWERPI